MYRIWFSYLQTHLFGLLVSLILSCNQTNKTSPSIPQYLQGIQILSAKSNFDLMARKIDIYITISTFTSVCPYGVGVGGVRRHVPLLNFQFLQSYDKVSLIKVGWYVLRVKNIHSWSPPDPFGPWDKEKASYIHYDFRREEAKLCTLKLASVFHQLPSVSPKQFRTWAHLGCNLIYFVF